MGNLVVIPLAVTFDFHNYDLWPPSVRVIDPLTRRWLELPRVRAIDFEPTDGLEVPLDLFIDNHPETGHVFLCKAGTREYHTHFEHSGDDWLLYRDQGFGTIGRLCDLLWRTAVRTIAGINIAAERSSMPERAEVGMSINVRQEKPQKQPQRSCFSESRSVSSRPRWWLSSRPRSKLSSVARNEDRFTSRGGPALRVTQ